MVKGSVLQRAYDKTAQALSGSESETDLTSHTLSLAD